MTYPSSPLWLRRTAGLAISGLLVLTTAPATAADDTTVKFGVPPWGGVEAKTAIVVNILEPLGYETEQISASAPVIYEGLAKGDVHINMSAWAPGQAPTFMPHVEEGTVIKLGENLKGAIAGFAVPAHVHEAGLTKAKQLRDYADKVDRTVFCIDPGSGANDVVNKAIDNDIYGLNDWDILESSTAGMLSRVGKAVENKEWIIFCGWRPHWMNVKYDMHYLDDPQDLWGPNGGESTVFTLANASFPENQPDLAEFFRRFTVDASVQSAWLFESGQQERGLGEIADDWISDNLDTVEKWVDHMKGPEGQDAMTVLRAEYQ